MQVVILAGGAGYNVAGEHGLFGLVALEGYQSEGLATLLVAALRLVGPAELKVTLESLLSEVAIDNLVNCCGVALGNVTNCWALAIGTTKQLHKGLACSALLGIGLRGLGLGRLGLCSRVGCCSLGSSSSVGRSCTTTVGKCIAQCLDVGHDFTALICLEELKVGSALKQSGYTLRLLDAR